MKIFGFLYLLLLFATVNCCTTRTAKAKIKNRSGHKILSATLKHRYSDAFDESKEFGVIEDGQDSTDYLSVRYHTGVGCNGYDWWLITWITDDGTAYSSDPDNGQCWLSILANAASDLLGAFSSIAGALTKDLVSAALQLLSTITEYTVNGSDFCGFKSYTLTGDDDDSEVNIILRPSASNGVKWESPSGSATTDYKILDIYPGFAVKPNVDLSGNDIGDLVNSPTSSSASACCNLCFMNSKCQSYTWQSINHKCYLKTYNSGSGIASSTAQSGILPLAGAAYFAVQNDWNFAGNDLNSSVASSYADCAMRCAKNSACNVFTMFKSNGLCLLKSSTGRGGAYKSDIISGYEGDYTGKFIRQSGADLRGNDLGDTLSPPVSRLIRTNGHNEHGKYHNFEYCPPGSWAYGFQQRVEKDQGNNDDDTALNAIRLYCRSKDGKYTGSISSYDGDWGDWSNNVYCSGDQEFMVSAHLKTEDYSFADCTGVNSFKSRCRDVTTNTISANYLEADNGAQWGDWKGEVICPQGTAICAISSKYYRASGIDADDQGMTDAEFICCALDLERTDQTSELQPAVGPFGDFRTYAYCPEGTWAYGFQQRVEPDQGVDHDDTALNAIRLYCRKTDGTGIKSISSYDGEWGDWSNSVYCSDPSTPFMFSAAFKIEDDQGTDDDDTTANGFKTRCWNGKAGSYSNVYVEGRSSGPWGKWKDEAACPEGSAICGISSKYEKSQDSGDDTAMNGAFFKCCSLPSERADQTFELRPTIGPFGDFRTYEYCPEGTWAYGFQQRVESDQGAGSDDTALNAIRLYCRKKDGTGIESISSYDGAWGNWSDSVSCTDPSAPFMFSATFKIEDDQGTADDDTSANGFKSRCWHGRPGS
ncbi:unnamed protein product, partial [Rotaria sp. Silwood2]